MNAPQEIQHWLKQHRQLKDETARDAFYQNLMATLGNKDSDMLQSGLVALKASVRASRVKAEKAVKAESNVSFQVSPRTLEEQEFLEQLLAQMDIPFKRSA